MTANPPASSLPERGKTGDILSVLTVEHQVDVVAQRDGVVTAISKDEGGAVKTGEVLAQLGISPADDRPRVLVGTRGGLPPGALGHIARDAREFGHRCDAAGEVHRHDGLGARRDRCADRGRIDHLVVEHVGEHRRRAEMRDDGGLRGAAGARTGWAWFASP